MISLTRMTLLAVAALFTLAAACGGTQTRQERASDRAEERTAEADARVATAEQEAEQARGAEEVIESHDPEAIEEADEILEETP